MSGILAPGAAVTGRSIALSLGISPAPVRDALKRLESDGVVEGKSKSAYFVNELSRETYLEIMNLRRRIEGYAAAKASKNARPEDLAPLEKVNAKYIVARSMAESIKLNYQFHFGIYRLAQSDVLLDVISNLWIRIGPSMHLYLHAYDAKKVANNHAKIIDALRKRDGRAAELALHRDLDEAVKVIALRLPSTRLSAKPRNTTGGADDKRIRLQQV